MKEISSNKQSKNQSEKQSWGLIGHYGKDEQKPSKSKISSIKFKGQTLTKK